MHDREAQHNSMAQDSKMAQAQSIHLKQKSSAILGGMNMMNLRNISELDF